jgi:hypothetical protein
MRILKLSEFFIKENVSLINHDGILLIVDVQSNFKKYFPTSPNEYLKKLDKYCEEFPKDGDIKGVYQIWDSNRGSKPTYKFKNQRDLVEKKFGIKRLYSQYKGGFKEWIYYIFDEDTLNKFFAKKNNFKEGDAFKIKDKDEYLVYIGNKHKWFYVNEEVVKLFQLLRGKKIIIVGGASEECLMDLKVSAESFNINPVYNHQYIYSAETGDPKLKK